MTAGSRKASAPTGGPPQPSGVHRDHVRIDLVDVDQAVRRGRRVIDDDQPAVLVQQLRRGLQIRDGAQSRRGRSDCDQAGRFGDQVLPLPGRQLAGLDVDLGPFHLGAIAIRRAQPRRDVCLVVQPGDDRFIAQAHPCRRSVGQRVEQDGAVGPEDDAARVGVEQVRNRMASRVQHRGAALSRRMRTHRGRHRIAERRRDGGGDGVRQEHAVLGVEVHPPIAQGRMQSAHPGDVVCHASHLRESVTTTNRPR